ncbi:TIGR02679 family protein [Polaromonas sp. P1-6]|nr:TIGR02679 family protein [Polaromonas sp. P1-6]
MAADDRLQRLLGGEPLAQLRLRLRQRFERAGSGAEVQGFRIERLTAAEHAALAALQGRPARFAASMQVDVATIDAALRQAGVADSLRAALEQLDGRIVDRAAEREAVQTQWREVLAGCDNPALASLLQTPAGIGLLKRLAGQNHAVAAHSLAGAEAVLNQLPAHGVTRAQLAANVLGDAHALDTGCTVATLVLAVLRSALTHEASLDPEDADPEGLSPRDLWASAGVLVNELARPALVLNLPGVAAPGEPAYLSLRSLMRSPPEWAVQGRTVFVCENPNLLAIAADHLGARCAPLVCTEGMPAAAQRTVLAQLAQAGAALRYHGDFDWPGLRIGNHVMREHGAGPWRFGAADYQAALGAAPSPGRLLQGAAVEASWDEALAAAMRMALQAIDEEMVADPLLQDLASWSG